jgi:hypothetical protein
MKPMRLVQFLTTDNRRRVGVPTADGQHLQVLAEATHVYHLARQAHRSGVSLTDAATSLVTDERMDYPAIVESGRLLAPLDHPSDAAHFLISGTGLDHKGSALARNAMHSAATSGETDSMKMFRLGLEGGKPAPGQIGAAPEWFYKGDGSIVVAPEQPLDWPAFTLDGGEEAELVGLYLIGDHGEVLRVGFALGNEYADHVLERQNYLYLAHSKLRQCSFGPELLLGPAPDNIAGRVRVIRDGRPLWDEAFATGEAHMTHSFANIEHHHFKYELFRRPGDLHAHYFGASALSCAAGIKTQPGDLFEIESPAFGRPLRNPIRTTGEPDRLVSIKTL